MKPNRNRHQSPRGGNFRPSRLQPFDRIAINALWLLSVGYTEDYICRRVGIPPEVLRYIKRSKRIFPIV